MTIPETLGKILYRGFVPIILPDRLSVPLCLDELVSVGIEAVEISCLREDFLRVVAETKRQYPNTAIGAAGLMEEGRLKDHISANSTPLPSIQQAVDAGVDFLVSHLPFGETTYERYGQSHVLVPSVITPGEAQQAVDAGAHLVNFLVPYLAGGPVYLKALDAATGYSLPIFTTGQVRFELLPGYIAAGALVCGAGFDTILGPDYRPMQNAFDEDYVTEALLRFVRTIERSRTYRMENVPFRSKDAVAISRATGRFMSV